VLSVSVKTKQNNSFSSHVETALVKQFIMATIFKIARPSKAKVDYIYETESRTAAANDHYAVSSVAAYSQEFNLADTNISFAQIFIERNNRPFIAL